MTACYTRELVQQLLPAVWDKDFAYGMENPTAPDPDMPKVKANPKLGNTLYAHLADIHAGWRAAPLSNGERRTLFLRYAVDWAEEEIGKHEHVSQQTVSNRIASGIGRLVQCMNGDTYEEDDPYDQG